MKNIVKLITAFVVTIAFAACDKIKDLPHYSNGTTPTLSASTTTVAATSADSTKTVLTLNWSNPKYSTDSLHQKFIIEIDSSGRNFSHEVTFEVDGPLSYSFTGSQLNNILANFGFAPGQAFNVDMRVTSSYTNNNEQYKSNIITVSMTPFLIPITLAPSSPNPLVLQISNATGNAISFNWSASAYGSNTISYALQLDTAGDNFAHPQTLHFDTSFFTSTILENDLNTAAINAGVIGGSTKNVEFRIVSYLGTGNTTPLVYSNIVTINLTTYTPVPANLYIVGDATPGGWSNPVSTPSQQFTKIDAVSFGIIINLSAGKSYLMLPLNGDWGHKYGGASATGGAILTDNAVPGSNTPAPATDGLYEIIVNFQTNNYTVTPYTGTVVPSNLYIVGDATAGGWNNPVPVPSQQFTQISNAEFQLTIPLSSGKSYLFLPLNGDWGHKFGGASDGTGAAGTTLLADGAVPGSNTPAPATDGTYVVDVNFITMAIKVTPQ